MRGKFVAYYRVSTQKQGRSGLGLEAQKEAVRNFLNGGSWSLVKELTEVESGKQHKNRPQLAEALRQCRVHRATLLVAKLDRLARNVAFISTLMEAGVKFVAADMPEANETMLHFMSVMAEHEAKAISARTTAALAAAKARGKALGGRRWTTDKQGHRVRWDIASVGDEGRQASLAMRQEKAAKYRADILPVIEEYQKNGITTLAGIAAALNADGTPASRGGTWSAVQVQRLLSTSVK